MGYGNSTAFYKKNPDKWVLRKQQIYERKRQIRERVQKYKQQQVCTQCGFSDHRAIDFHHRDPSQKDVEIALIHNKGWSWKRIQAELEKCDALCRNCHAILHAEERNVSL